MLPFDHLWRRKPEPQHLISYYCSISFLIYIHIHSLKTTPSKWDQPHSAMELVLLHPHLWTTLGLLEAQPMFLHAARSWLNLEIVPLWIMWKIIHASWAWRSRDRSSGKRFGKIPLRFAHLRVLASAFQQRHCRCSCIDQQSQFKIISVYLWSDEKFIFYEREFMLEFRLTHLAKTSTQGLSFPCLQGTEDYSLGAMMEWRKHVQILSKERDQLICSVLPYKYCVFLSAGRTSSAMGSIVLPLLYPPRGPKAMC